MKKLLLYLAVLLYVLAGINHFINPGLYTRLIPPYLPLPGMLNYASGVFEIVLGVMLVFSKSRFVGTMGIVLMLVAFIPAHIYSIQIACGNNEGCTAQWIAWIRLFIIHPFLIVWAWRLRNLTITS